MPHTKRNCVYCPPRHHKPPAHGGANAAGIKDWEMHPSFIAGIEAIEAYGDWVSSFVLPIAFQWIEEHKEQVYASIPEELKDDVGVVIAAAFRVVKELPAYKLGLERRDACEAEAASEKQDSSKTNPVWTGIVKKVRNSTEEAFQEQAKLIGDTEES